MEILTDIFVSRPEGCYFKNGEQANNCTQGLELMCDASQDFFAFSTSSFSANTHMFEWLILFSFLGNMFLYFTIKSDVKLQEHPMNLFGTLAFQEGFLFWIYYMEPKLCPIDSDNFFYAVTFPYGLQATER